MQQKNSRNSIADFSPSTCPVDIDTEFKHYLGELVPLLLAPENLVTKTINGNPITGNGLLQCFRVCVCGGRGRGREGCGTCCMIWKHAILMEYILLALL